MSTSERAWPLQGVERDDILLALDYATAGTGANPGTILQNRGELFRLCEWMEQKDIRSYLEIGFFMGTMLRALDAIFKFEKVAGCDEGLTQKRRGIVPELPPRASICWARTESAEYRKFRPALGKMDLVFIDADHSYGSVRQDYEREKRQPHRFLAFHDISNPEHPGVGRLWREIGGKKREISIEGSGMGIGIWSEREAP